MSVEKLLVSSYKFKSKKDKKTTTPPHKPSSSVCRGPRPSPCEEAQPRKTGKFSLSSKMHRTKSEMISADIQQEASN